MKTLGRINLFLFFALALVGCTDESSSPSAGGQSQDGADIVDVAVDAGFSSLASALTTADLVSTLKTAGPFTVFAPTDEAFADFEAANPGVLGSLSVEELTEILTYHVVSGRVLSTDLNSGEVTTLQGSNITVDLSSGVMINDAMVTMADVIASNGVIHIIDTILLPPADEMPEPMAMPEPMGPGNIIDVAVEAGSFTQLAGALQTAGLVEALQGEGPFTVFAPSDAAFDAFEAANPGVIASLSVEDLTSILTYHVIAGASVGSADLVDASVVATLSGAPVYIDLSNGAAVNDATISATDIAASNGVIHVIDSIILPPEGDIIETALAAGSFTRLADALTTADLVGALQGEGPFTVFAPSDDAFTAFEAANPGVLGSLSKEELTNILLYHVVDGLVGAGDLQDGSSVETLMGSTVDVDLSAGAVINNASVVGANVLSTNGVIHVIDTILLPPAN